MLGQKSYSKFQFFIFLIIAIILFLFLTFILKVFFSLDYLVLGFLVCILTVTIVGFRLIQLMYKMQYDKIHDINQIESLLWIYQEMKLANIIPPMGHYAGTPDFYKVILHSIKLYKPKIIVELGSGVSTFVISEFLEYNNFDTELISLDHEKNYADETAQRIQNSHTKVLFTPLVNYKLNDESYFWYDIENLKDVDNIDLLIIDGPPENVSKLARFPALPLLWSKLSPEAIIIMDDANRKDVQEITKRWEKAFDLKSEFVHNFKGTKILRKIT